MKAMTCPYCGMPVQVRPLTFVGPLITYRVTCPFCTNQCTLNVWVRLAAGLAALASVGLAVILAILFISTYTERIDSLGQLGIALLGTAVMIIVLGGQALSVVICSKFGSLTKPGVL